MLQKVQVQFTNQLRRRLSCTGPSHSSETAAKCLQLQGFLCIQFTIPRVTGKPCDSSRSEEIRKRGDVSVSHNHATFIFCSPHCPPPSGLQELLPAPVEMRRQQPRWGSDGNKEFNAVLASLSICSVFFLWKRLPAREICSVSERFPAGWRDRRWGASQSTLPRTTVAWGALKSNEGKRDGAGDAEANVGS